MLLERDLALHGCFPRSLLQMSSEPLFEKARQEGDFKYLSELVACFSSLRAT
jgi:hypothetical protein